MPDKNKVGFSDLDGFLKVAPMIALLVLGYLQTLFPSKAEFEKVHDKLIQMDKKLRCQSCKKPLPEIRET